MQKKSVVDQTFRREAAAAYLQMSLSTFNTLYKTGKIKCYKTSPKKIFFKKSDLDTYVQSQLVTANIY